MSLRDQFKRTVVGASPGMLSRLDRVSKLRTVHPPPATPYAALIAEGNRPANSRAVNLTNNVFRSPEEAYQMGYRYGREVYMGKLVGEVSIEYRGPFINELRIGYRDGRQGFAYHTSWP